MVIERQIEENTGDYPSFEERLFFKEVEMVKKRIIEDIISDECEKSYCILREIILHSGMNDYMLEQTKCIEKFKYEESERERRDIGWEEAVKRWVDRGYAKRFREVYSEDLSFRDLYKKVVYAPEIKNEGGRSDG